MSTLGSLVSSIGGATGSKGSYSLVDLVKNPEIQSALNDLISSYSGQTARDSTDLNTFLKNWAAGQGQAEQNTSQETGAINRYYNGDVARQLADLRAQQAQLGNQAVAQALAYQRGNQNRALVAGGGGGGSYVGRQALATAAPLILANNTQNLAQERSDVNAVNSAQLGLIGQRTSLADALARRPLTPITVGQGVLGSEIGNIGGLTNVNNANNMFGAQYNPSQAEWGGAVTGAAEGVGATVVGGFMGGGSGMGGGGGGGGGGSSTGQPGIPMGEAGFYGGGGGGGGGAPSGYTGYGGFSGWGAPQNAPTNLDYYNNMGTNAWGNPMTSQIYEPGYTSPYVGDYTAPLTGFGGAG